MDDTNDPADDFLTFREAIQVANGTLDVGTLSAAAQALVVGTVNSGPVDRDEIQFAIPGASTDLHTLVIGSALPTITDPVVIDGYTQGDASPNSLNVGSDAVILVELDLSGSGLVLSGGDTLIRGLSIGTTTNDPGITINSSNNVVEGNHIGVDATGTQSRENPLIQVHVVTGADNLIGGTTPAARNVIAGGFSNGAGMITVGNTFDALDGPANTRIQGNYIGTNAAGLAALGSGGFYGVMVNEGLGTLIGGDDAADGSVDGVVFAGNLISGSTSQAIAIRTSQAASGQFDGVTIQGNVIGLDSTGNAALAGSVGIGTDGTRVEEGLIQIGGTTPGAGNVISGHTSYGLLVNALNVVIQGNRIGTNVTGDVAIGNAIAGVSVQIGGNAGIPTLDYLVGGNTPEARNLISGNGTSPGDGLGNGIEASGIDEGSLRIQGNWIGLAADGVTALPNTGNGVDIVNRQALIGGSGAGEGNVIAFNGMSGVVVTGANVSTVTATILGNSIYANTGLGIDLGGSDPGQGAGIGNGVTANDTLDPDTGPNQLQNFPIVTSSTVSATQTLVTGTLNSEADTTYRIEFFASDVADPSGNGEGRTYLGFVDVTTDLNGDATFTDVVLTAAPAGQLQISATATNTSTLNTSEFSLTVTATPAAESNDISVTVVGAPDPANPGDQITYTITVTTGPGSDVTDLLLSTAVPGELAFVSFDAPVGFTLTLPNVGEAGPITATAPLVTSDAPFVFTLVVLADPIALADATEVTVTASVESATDDPNLDNNTASDTTAINQVADLQVAMSVDPSTVPAGTNLTYTIIVTNNGPSTAADVTLSTAVPAQTTFVSFAEPGGWTVTAPAVGATGAVAASIASLASGATATFTFVVLVDLGAIEDSNISATATVDATGSEDPDTSNNEISSLTLVLPPPPSADLSIEKTASATPVILGQNFTYTLVVSNAGPDDATNVVVTDQLSPNVTFVSATGGVTPDANGLLTFNLGTLANGGEVTLEIVVTPTVLGALDNTGEVTSDIIEVDPSNNESLVSSIVASLEADLDLTKVADVSVAVVGQEITYTLTVTNLGATTATETVVTDTLPTGVTFVSATGGAVPDGSGVLTFNVGDLAFGASQVFTIVIQPTAFGTIVNNAVASFNGDDFDPTNDTASASVDVTTVADLAISMTATPDPVNPEGQVTYTLTVTNNGPNDAINVEVGSAVPTFTTFVSFAAPAGWNSTTPAVGALGSITSTIGNLASGETAVFTLIVAVDANVADGVSLAAPGTVESETADSDNTNNSTSAAVLSDVTETDLTIGVTVSSPTVNPSQDLTYTITVTNTGQIAAENVEVNTATPAQSTFVSFAAPSGWTNTLPAVGATGAISSTIASLGAGQTAVFTFVVKVDASATLGSAMIASATVETTTPESNASNNTASAGSQVTAPLTTNVNVTLADSVDPATVGQPITYTAVVTNTGTGPAAGVVLNISVPSNVTIVSLGGGTQTATGVQFTIGTLAASGSQQFQIIVQASSTGTQTLTATVTADSGVTVGSPDSETTTIGTDGGGGDGDPPTVESVVRYGFHAQATILVVSYSQAMDAASAGNPANYTVIISTTDDILGNADDTTVSIAAAFYDSTTNEVTLRVSERVYAFRPWSLEIDAAIEDLAGNALDGNGDGVGGDDASVPLDLSSIVGTADQAPNADQVGVTAVPNAVVAVQTIKPNGRIAAARKAKQAKQAAAKQQVRIQRQQARQAKQAAKVAANNAKRANKLALAAASAIAVAPDAEVITKLGQKRGIRIAKR